MMSPLGISNTQPRNFEAPRSAELVPGQIRETANTFISLLNEYYVWLNKADLPSNILYSALSETDIDLASSKHISNIAASIAKYIPHAVALDRVALYKKIVKYYYNTRGSRESAHVFFRIFFDAIIEIVDASNGSLNSSIKLWLAQYTSTTNPTILKYAEQWRPFTYGIVTEIDSSRWNIPFKALIHPIGFRYFHIVKLLIISRNAWLDLNGELDWSYDNLTNHSSYPVMFGQIIPGSFGDMKFATPGSHSPTIQTGAYTKHGLTKSIVRLILEETNTPRDTVSFQYLDTRPLNTWQSIDYKNDEYFNVSPIYKYRIEYSPNVIKTARLKVNTKIGYPTYMPGIGVSMIYSTMPINGLSDLSNVISDPNKQYNITNSLVPYIHFAAVPGTVIPLANITTDPQLTYANNDSDVIIKARGTISIPYTGTYDFIVFASNAFNFSIKYASSGIAVEPAIIFDGDYNNFASSISQQVTHNKNGISLSLHLPTGDYLIELDTYQKANSTTDAVSVVSGHYIDDRLNNISKYPVEHSNYILLGSKNPLNPFTVKCTSTSEVALNAQEFNNTITFADNSNLAIGQSMLSSGTFTHEFAKITSIKPAKVITRLASTIIVNAIIDSTRMSGIIPRNSLEALIHLTTIPENIKDGMTVHMAGIPAGSKIKTISASSITISLSEPLKTDRYLSGDVSFSSIDSGAVTAQLSFNNLALISSTGVSMRSESNRIIVTNNSNIKVGQRAVNALLDSNVRVTAILGKEIILSKDNISVSGIDTDFRFIDGVFGIAGEMSLDIFPPNLNLIPGMKLSMSPIRTVQTNSSNKAKAGSASILVSITKDALSDKAMASSFKNCTVITSGKKLASPDSIITVTSETEHETYVELKLTASNAALFENAPLANDILTLIPPSTASSPIITSISTDSYSQNVVLDSSLPFSFPGIATFAISQDYTT